MNKPLRTIIFIVLAVVVVGAVAYVLFTKKVHSPTGPLPEEVVANGQRYTNLAYDFRFAYPDGYSLTEREEGGRYSVTLVRTEDATPPEGGEGPTAITVDVYENDTTALDWITTTNESNYKLGDGQYTQTTVAGEPAYTYTWSGLYEGKTTVVAHGGDLIALSVTWMNPEDDILDEYERVLASFEFDEFNAPSH